MSESAPRVVIVGGSAAAWLAASSLVRALKHRHVEVTVVDPGPPADAPAGDWTLPSTPGMHRLLGIPENTFLRNTGATFRLGSAHLGWQDQGSQFVHPHGEIGSEMQGIPFYQLILQRRLAGERTLSPDLFSLAAMALHLARFARPVENEGLKSSFTYGYHLPLAPYLALLRDHARAQGVKIIEGQVAGAEFDARGHTTAVKLLDEQKVPGELFIDASGRASALMSLLPDHNREDWSAWLPCDRIVSGLGAPLPQGRAATETQAMSAGWWFRFPLAAGSVVGAVYQSGLQSDEFSREQLRQFSGVRDAVITRFRAGRRRRFWVGNCVAIGESAMELEPLAGASLHFAQLGIGVLLELFPLDTARRVEADEYNRVMAEHADGLRDFTLAHYLVATRPGEMWEGIRATPPPERLAMRLALFKASGRILTFDQESFEETDWAWLLLGSGGLPDSLEAQTSLRAARITHVEVASLASQVNSLAQSMPPHALFLQHASQSRAG